MRDSTRSCSLLASSSTPVHNVRAEGVRQKGELRLAAVGATEPRQLGAGSGEHTARRRGGGEHAARRRGGGEPPIPVENCETLFCFVLSLKGHQVAM